MPESLAELNSRLALPDVLRFEVGPGGLVRAVIRNELASATVYLHGAHVAEYQHHGQPPLLFMSGKSSFDPGKPIRGGVPICFPWFGPNAANPAAPAHGFARILPWTLDSAAQQPDGATRLVFSLTDSDESRQLWPHRFGLSYTVTAGRSLELSLEVHNCGPDALRFEEALHTYLAMSDVRQVSIEGLAGAIYIDKADGARRKQQGDEPIRVTAETDRAYLDTASTVAVRDPIGRRTILVEKSGSNTTVVWNPWIAKARAMPDFGDEEWPGMLCIETANAVDNAVTLAAGQKHMLLARISAAGE